MRLIDADAVKQMLKNHWKETQDEYIHTGALQDAIDDIPTVNISIEVHDGERCAR